MDKQQKKVESIKSFIESDAPLRRDAINMLVEYKEEDMYVDYKQTFDSSNEKQWIGITTDVLVQRELDKSTFLLRDFSCLRQACFWGISKLCIVFATFSYRSVLFSPSPSYEGGK